MYLAHTASAQGIYSYPTVQSDEPPPTTYLDMFCGSGGSITGALRAMRELGLKPSTTACNHWTAALDTLSANYPELRYFNLNLMSVSPTDVIPWRRVSLAWASPSCKHFSKARAGRPTGDQMRVDPNDLIRWLKQLDVERLIVENVWELTSWGPVDRKTGRPIESKKGLYFRRWLGKLRSLGYALEYRKLVAADYGDATLRERFFLLARKDGKPIVWPRASHSRDGGFDCEGNRLERWVPASAILDWSDLGTPLHERKKPLSLKTRLRMARGFLEQTGPLAPFFVRLLDLPAEIEARLLDRARAAAARSPHLVVEPFVLGQHGGSIARAVSLPLPTVATSGAIALVSPMIVPYYGTGVADSVGDPLATVPTKGRFALCSGVAVPLGRARFTPYIVANFGERPDQSPRIHAISKPLPTVTGRGAGNLITPTIDHFEGPADGIDPRRRVVVNGVPHLLTVYYRMLRVRELARSMSFDDEETTYTFTGTKTDQLRMIGNAVPCRTARALVRAIMSD